jgi:hypothetical protein
MTALFTSRKAAVRSLAAGLCLTLSLVMTASARINLVPKWSVFEQDFRSGVDYKNPVQECALKVLFVSPGGETNSVDGFWDGGKTWRVRFSPNQPGHWTYLTSCSDTNNQRLNNQTGEFLCTSPTGPGRFAQHGPLQLSRNRFHFEHADGTPFFWLADVAWNGPRLSTSRDWTTYTQVRSNQNFSAVQWAAVSGVDPEKHSPFSGKDKIEIDPAYFQRLDEKVAAMNRAGLLSVIAPFWGNQRPEDLSDDQAVLLLRYLTARWGAYDVAWLLMADGYSNTRWQKIGREAFGSSAHEPVIVFPGEMASSFADFQNENWVDAFGFGIGQTMNDDALQWLVSGPMRKAWKNYPPRPLINVLPPLENGLAGKDRVKASDVCNVAWWSLLLAPPAGVSYGAQDVADWNPAVQSKLPSWQLSLFLPGAKQMKVVADFFNSENCRGNQRETT